jgi:hypothetical protein
MTEGENMRELAERYEMLTRATRDRIREINVRLQSLSGELDVTDAPDDGAKPNDQN